MQSPFHRWSLRNRLTLGIVLLSAISFSAIFGLATLTMRGYLISQVDEQLTNIAGGTTMRLDRTGIETEAQELPDDDDRPAPKPKRNGNPLRRLPSTISATVIDANGNLVGGLGGDLNRSQVTDYLNEIEVTNNQPFTIEDSNPKFRVITQRLPNTGGYVIYAQSLDSVQKLVKQLQAWFILIGLIALFVIAFASRAVIRVGLRPLHDVEGTAEQIASGDLSARMPESKPNTEVGRLVKSLNGMLSRIEDSFAVRIASESKLRRFVADASHELRTPLTAIRGFSELYRQGAVKGEVETKELIGRIENESIRMGHLVEDLLLLARLDQSREMKQEPVNISSVVAESVESARAAGPDHPITVNAGEEIYVVGDVNRIHQVIANLLANARIHTPAGTKINVVVTEEENAVSVTVSDNGPGLNDQDREKIFERFYRADKSRSRTGQEGTGLGLSIVDAVMRAHGGHVSVDSKLGEGTSFKLVFPLHRA